MKKIVCLAALLAASLAATNAQNITPITAWSFDNVAAGYNASPVPSSGFGTASAVGLGNGSTPSIVSLSGSSSGGPLTWQFAATGGSGSWSTSAAIGSQGAEFTASTIGNYQIQISFDVNATANAEGALQVQYTTDGNKWYNATITSVGSGATIQNNPLTNNIVHGSYVTLSSGWNNQITVNLAGISQVDDAPDFAIRIVNAATGSSCLDTTGALYNNSNNTASWTFDNVVISGLAYSVVADWPFDNIGKKSNVNSPAPAIAVNGNAAATAACFGFYLPNVTFSGGAVGSTNAADVTANGSPYSSTGPAGQYVWRLRGTTAGGYTGNGWYSGQPIGSQGGEFDVSTVNFTNVILTFDLYMTSQGEAKYCVLYTTNAWATTNIAQNLSYGLSPSLIATNSNPTLDPYTVAGTYFDNDYGSIFFNNMVVDFTGIPYVANNTQFKFRIVNAATGIDCVNYLGQPYNNNSGNMRLDNVEISGQFLGSYPPAITNQVGATADFPFTNTFAVTPHWTTNISSIYANGVLLTNNTAYKVFSNSIVFYPAGSAALQLAGLDSLVIFATNFASATVSQLVGTGNATLLTIQQPAPPTASGGTLTVNPYFELSDQYGNPTTNPYTSFYVTASISNSPATWVLGGHTNQPIINGYCMFTDLTASVIGSTPVTNAAITFTVTGYTNAMNIYYSTNFNIGAPPVPFTRGNLAAIQIDTLGNNTTFSIIELQPSTANQTTPVNIVPISATGTNALRLSSAGSCGKLALSDNGTFLVFNAFQDNSSATPDETFNLNRAVGTLDAGIDFTSPVSYVSSSLGGSQARSACSPDNQDFLIDDKGGLYVNSTISYVQNNVSVRSFAGNAWVLTAKTADPATADMFEFTGPDGPIEWDASDAGNDGPFITPSLTPPSDSTAQDFYMIATNGAYDIAYICDQAAGANGTNGIITKWVFQNDANYTWVDQGSWTNNDDCDTLLAVTNGCGGAYIYYANGSGGQGGNQLIRVTDQSLAGPLNIIATNVIYQAPANSSIEGVTFVPQTLTNGIELTPAPVLYPAAPSLAGNPFTITAGSDDPTWRASITNVTVNGSVLSPSDYNATVAGQITFNGSLSAGADTIVISATGYSSVSVVQTLTASPSVTTLAASSVTAGSAILNASVNPNGVTTAYWFKYGPTTSYGSSTATNILTGSSPVNVANLLSGLSGGSTYHYQIVATNSVGPASGSDMSFTTLSVTPPNATSSGGGSVFVSNGSINLSFTNATGASFHVLGTNNLTAPVSTWPVVGQAVETPAGSGNYVFSAGATNGLEYYILRNP